MKGWSGHLVLSSNQYANISLPTKLAKYLQSDYPTPYVCWDFFSENITAIDKFYFPNLIYSMSNKLFVVSFLVYPIHE